MTERLIGAALVRIAGRPGVIDDAAALAAAAVDGRTPRWVVTPRSVEQVAAVLALAREEGLAVLPRGSGSALDLGHPPAALDVVLETRGLARVIDYNPDDLTVSVEAGVLAGTLGGRLSARRQWLPIDPAGVAARTVGGLTATGAAGPLRLRYGTLRDLLLGVRFVQADGVVTWGGARVVKSVTGYDVPKLMVGALGTLGVLVEMTFRLHPRPPGETTWLASFPAADGAQAFAAAVLDSPLQPNRLEALNGVALRACAVDPAPIAVAVTIGSVEAAVREQGVLAEQLAARCGGAWTPAPSDFWARWDHAFAKGEDDVVLMVSSPASRLRETLGAIEARHGALTAGADPMVSGCAALGALRVTLTGGDAGEVAALVEGLRGDLGPHGGGVVVQAARAGLRAQVDPWGPIDPGALGLMKALKDEFDPTRVLNPGRFVGGL
ncbi:MAG TPA: FAD-binding oxidoreductase [Methylomirabilota bacterium]|nr:FAD-binding oxidoreductase [Methylomirabilota bacterium]